MWMNRILRVGTGCGVEIRGSRLNVTAVKSRPGGVTLLGRVAIEDFRERSPREWGAEYNEFLKGLRLSHLSCSVSLPRQDVIVREIYLPVMPRKELAAAVGYQLDGLHPYEQDEVYYTFAPLRKMSEEVSQIPVAVVVAEKTKIDQYASTFEEAGIAVETFTVAAAAFYAGVRVRWDSPPVPFVIADFTEHGLEIYGEGRTRPLFSARFDLGSIPAERALQLAGADLRIEDAEPASIVLVGGALAGGSETDEAEGRDSGSLEVGGSFEPRSVEEILPSPDSPGGAFDIKRNAAALAVGLEAACPRLGWRANLLPPERRKKSARWMYLPTGVLAGALVLLGLAFLLRPWMQDRDYIDAVQAEVTKLDEVVAQVEQSLAETQQNKARLAVLRSLRQRTEADLSIVRELSNLLPDTVWLTRLEVNDEGVRIQGEGDRAAPLLGIINDAETLASAEFLTSIVTTDKRDRFQISARRRATQESATVKTSSRERTAAATPKRIGAADEGTGSTTLSTVSEAEGARSP
jgi:Tfp pilus assembly protein PilN